MAKERTLHVSFKYCYLDIFTKIKLVLKNTNSSFGVFFSCFACTVSTGWEIFVYFVT